MTLAKGHISVVCQHIQRTSPLKPLPQFLLNFILQAPGEGGKIVYIFRLGHLTEIAAVQIYSENLKKSSSPEPLDRLV